MFHVKSGAIPLKQLKEAAKRTPDGVIRFAKFLKLEIDGMSVNQVATLIRWRITRPDMDVIAAHRPDLRILEK